MSGISVDQVRDALLYLIALILSISVHEFGHAFMANRLGDGLPAAQGRLTLNPLRHIDPIGTIVFPLLAFAGAPVLGWGRPVQTNPMAYTRRFTRRTGNMFVALAGPAMNLVMALAVSLVVIVLARMNLVNATLLLDIELKLVALNLSLMFFNLLPIPPLDGGAVLARVLPQSMQSVIEFLERWGFMILLALMLTGGLSIFMGPAYRLIGLWLAALNAVAMG